MLGKRSSKRRSEVKYVNNDIHCSPLGRAGWIAVPSNSHSNRECWRTGFSSALSVDHRKARAAGQCPTVLSAYWYVNVGTHPCESRRGSYSETIRALWL
jgi:hypothetical protein